MIEVFIFIIILIGALFAIVIFNARRSMVYVFCNVTISTWEARLLSESRLMEFTEAPGISNIFAGLEDTEYRTQLAEAKGEMNEIMAVERALRKNLNTRYQELLAILPKQRKETILRILRRADIWNLKTLISMIHSKVPKDQRLKELLSSPVMSRERLEMLASAGDLSELLEFLKGSEYFDVISEALEEYKEKGLIAILSALDKHYYTALWEDVLAEKSQRSILKTIVGHEIDAVNAKLILRLKQEGVPPDQIDKYLLRPSYELTDKMLKAMVTAEDIRSSIHMIHITSQGKILADAVSRIEERGVVAAEQALDEANLKLCKIFEFTKLFSIAPVISYIYLKENEVKNLRAIIRLKADGVEPQKIKEKIARVPKVGL